MGFSYISHVIYFFQISTFLVANGDGLANLGPRCFKALGDKSPFRVSGGYDAGDGSYVFLIKWLLHQKRIYDLLIYVITMKLQNLFYFDLYFQFIKIK